MQTGAARGVPVYVRIYSAKGLTMPELAQDQSQLSDVARICRARGHRYAETKAESAEWDIIEYEWNEVNGKRRKTAATIKQGCVRGCKVYAPPIRYKLAEDGRRTLGDGLKDGGYDYAETENYRVAKGVKVSRHALKRDLHAKIMGLKS